MSAVYIAATFGKNLPLPQSLSSSLPLSLDVDRAVAAPDASGRGGCGRLSPPSPPPIALFPYSAPPLCPGSEPSCALRALVTAHRPGLVAPRRSSAALR